MNRFHTLNTFALIGALGIVASGCGGSDAACTPAGAQKSQYVVDSFVVPQSKTDYAIDQNGDGMPDNQLGGILSFLASSGLNPQTGVDDSLNMGALIVLMNEQSNDASFMSDSCAGLQVGLGTSSTMTAPMANAHFTATGATDQFSGPLTDGAFSSESQRHVDTPTSLTLSLPFLPGTDPLQLVLTGVTFSFTRDGSGKLTGGTLDGVVKNSDLQTSLLPSFATILTQKVQRNLGQASTNMQILMLFDNGGTASSACGATCQNPDKSCATSGDTKIDPCEVSTSFLSFAIVPDLQMYDGTAWAPTTSTATPDSLSVGIGWTAVPAAF